MSTIYENITALCRGRGITGAKMCIDIGVSKSLMTSLKTGRTKTINSQTAQKIADYFGVPVGIVVGERVTLTDVTRALAKEYFGQKNTATDEIGSGVSEEDLEIIKLFRSASPEKQEAIRALLK